MFLSRAQAIRNLRKHIPDSLSGFTSLISLFFVSSILLPLSLSAQTGSDSLNSQVPVTSYILKETGTSTVLMAKDVDRPVSPASLTKILTCTMAIESGRLEQEVLITKESTMVEPSKAGFKPGERIKLVDLVKAAMVNSSNDAAFAIAIYLSGNVDSFVSAMNAKAKMIGMKNSSFTNPAGFDKGIYAGNTSTAGDLLRLTEYAVRNSVFNEIAHLDKAVFTEETTHKVYCLKTHNKLLDKYPYAVGIKTGFTNKAGGCLIARAIKNNRDMLLVMLNAKTDRWNIAANMFDMAFLGNRPDPAWIVQTRGDSGRAGVSVIKQRERLDTVSSGKSGKSVYRLSKATRRLRSNHVVLSKSGRRSHQHALAQSKPLLHSRREAQLLSRSNHKAKRGTLAVSNAGRKSKKHDLASSKQVRRNKKKVTLS